MATITISITDCSHMGGYEDTESEAQAAFVDAAGIIESAIENALQVNNLEGDVSVEIDS